MSLSERRAEQLAANGAAWLDDNVPGWMEHINISTLNLSSDMNDVLGQIASFASDDEQASSYSWWVDESRWHSHLRESTYRTLMCDCAEDEGCNVATVDDEVEDHEAWIENVAWYGFTDEVEGVTYEALNFAWQEELRDRGLVIPPAPAVEEPF
jgi:hypothetical protein